MQYLASATLWRWMRTTNSLERLKREIHRKARVTSVFPNQASWLRLIYAILNENSEERLTGRTYLIFEDST